MLPITPTIRLFGIRHHGPGSARSLRRALADWQPDILLIEGPPEANGVMHWLGHDLLEPPVALLTYHPADPRRATYFPFAIFSPELQAIRYALAQGIPARFMDIPQAHRLAVLDAPAPPTADAPEPAADPTPNPFQLLANAAGYDDHESWWNQMVEERQDGTALFEAILEVMEALRAETAADPTDQPLTGAALFEARREATMRHTIRQAQAEGFQRLAVICGAWHTAALRHLDTAEADAALLADMPRVPVEATWVPWTYGRLGYQSGYGAGVRSPGWYHHLWEAGEKGWDSTTSSVHWLTRVARLLREQDLDASAAHVIETVRLAEALASLRGRARPGLGELTEATQSVLCFGAAEPLRLVEQALVVSERMGSIPPDMPMVPLQRDLYRQQQRLKLRPQAEESKLKLDVRQATHLERSQLLHRLNLLGLPWGQMLQLRGQQGTYHEVWKLKWRPDFAVLVVEASLWGNTVHDAAQARAHWLGEQAADLPTLTTLLDQLILADLPEVLARVMARVEELAAVSHDVWHLMDALPPLVQVWRYGSARQSGAHMVRQVIDGLLTRLYVGLPGACPALNDKSAEEMLKRLVAVQGVVNTLDDAEHMANWHNTLTQVADLRQVHGLVAGKCCRLLLEAGVWDVAATSQRLRRAVGLGGQALPAWAKEAADWLDGFLQGSILLLLHDQLLWQVLDEWVLGLPTAEFEAVLPLVRRTFNRYSKAERRQIGELLRRGAAENSSPTAAPSFDHGRAAQTLPLIAQLLGVRNTS